MTAHTPLPAPDPPARKQERSPFLPIDTPPRTTRLPPSALRGLVWEADLGTIPSMIGRPYSQNQSTTFPLSLPSQAGPPWIDPRYGYSINGYSPSRHWWGRLLFETVKPVPVVKPDLTGTSKGPRRIRGQVAPYPPADLEWRSMFGHRTV